MFCVSCGKEIEDGALFCEHCGARQEEPAAQPAPAPAAQPTPAQSTPVVNQTTVAPAPAAPAAPKKPMSKKTKIILGVVAGVVVLFIALKVILGSVNDPTKTINKFLDAIRNQDGDAFRQVATVYLDEIELTDENLTPFFTAYSKDNSMLTEYQAALMEDLNYINQGMVAPGNGFIRLVENSNVLFSSYKVEITPITATLYSEFDGTKLTLNGTEYEVGYDGVPVQMLPGAYSGTATYTDENTGVTLNTEFTDRYVTSYDNYLNVDFEYTSAYIESSSSLFELKELYVDGTAVSMDLSEVNFYYGFSLEPVGTDSEIRIVATAYGIDFEQTFNMADSSTCYFSGELPAEMEEEVVAMASDLVPLWMNVHYSYSQEACNTIVANYGTSSSEFTTEQSEWLTSRLESMNQYPQYYSYYVLSDLAVGEITTDSVSFYDDGLYVRLQVPVTGTSTYYSEWGATTTDAEPSSIDGYARVTLIYANGSWTIDSVAGIY